MPLNTLDNKFQHKKLCVYQFTICKEGSMGTPIVKGLTEVHHCATYSPPQPLLHSGVTYCPAITVITYILEHLVSTSNTTLSINVWST